MFVPTSLINIKWHRKLFKLDTFAFLLGYRLIFPGNRTVENYAMKQPVIASNLNAFSLCFFLKVIPDEFENDVISYAKDNANDLLIHFTRHLVGIHIGGEER